MERVPVRVGWPGDEQDGGGGGAAGETGEGAPTSGGGGDVKAMFGKLKQRKEKRKAKQQ